MARITHTIRITSEGNDDIHLPGVPGQFETVCGFVDVAHEELNAQEHPANCKSCFQIARAIRKMRLPDGSLP